MISRRHVLGAASVLALPTASMAQAWPAKPIRLIVPFAPGGGTDVLARLIGTRLAEATHWSIVPENRAGAGGTLGIGEAVKAAPTGHDLVMGQKDNLVVAPWLYKSLSYDPARDLQAVAHVAYSPIIFVTSAKSRFKTLADAVAAAKASPDSLTYGSPGNGTTIHLSGEILNTAAHIKLRHIPYKGSNPALMDLIAGNVDLMVASIPSVMSHVRAGTVRPLAVTSAQRSSTLPDVPTVAESGYPGFDVSTWYGLFAPAGTPKEVVVRINAEVNKLLADASVQEAIRAQGAEAKAMTPEAFGAQLRAELPAWKTIVEKSGAKLE